MALALELALREGALVAAPLELALALALALELVLADADADADAEGLELPPQSTDV